jgi:type IV secretion system protein VirB10
MSYGDRLRPDPQQPETPSLPKSGVRRVNNVPLLLLIGIFVVFVGIMAMVATKRSNAVNKAAATASTGTDEDAALIASRVAGKTQAGIVGEKQEPIAPMAVPVAYPTDAPPLPPASAGPAPDDGDLQRLRMIKLQQLQQAINAKSKVEVSNLVVAQGAASAAKDPRPDTPRAIAVADDAPEGEAAQPPRSDDAQGMGVYSRSKANYSQFSGNARRWDWHSPLEAPETAYELRAGFVIPAIMISGINSDLPGQIAAQVSQDVYDTATGKYRLIPQGSRLVGTYSSQVAYGQRRVLVAWQRIVFPDGKALDIGAMPGTDSGGFSGFEDKVNNHYLRIFGSAILMSGIIAGVAQSQQGATTDANGTPTFDSTLSMSLGQELGQVASQMIQKNLNIAPTMEIRSGYRFNVMVTKDLAFSKPYQAFDY